LHGLSGPPACAVAINAIADSLSNNLVIRSIFIFVFLFFKISACHKQNKYVGICGQGPSDHLDLAQWLMQQGIGSLSLTPDSIVKTWLALAKR